MSETINCRGASNSSSRPIHSVIKGQGPDSSVRSTIEGTGNPNRRIMSDLAPMEVKRAKNIDPIAAHIKEVNHIDPISVESLRVTTIRDVEPLRIDEVNVANVPTLNHTVRSMPSLDMSVRRVPPMSVGLHQHFEVPSDYTMSATVLGFEVARLTLKGISWIIPHQDNKPERHIERNKSYPVEAVAGNPTIPVNCRVASEEVICAPCYSGQKEAGSDCRSHSPGSGFTAPADSHYHRSVSPASRPGLNVGTLSPGGLNS